MASRNNRVVAGNDEPEDVKPEGEEEEYKIPDEIGESAPSGMITPPAVNGNTSTSGGMSLEELDAKGFNESRDEELRAAMDPPGGDWFKTTRWEWEKRVYANDNMPDDLDPAGRTIFSFWGEVETRVMGQHTYTPKLFLRLSPDARFKADDPDKIDMAHKLWLRAKDLYLSVKEEKPTIRKLIIMMAEDEYIVRTMKGDGGPVAVDVKRKVERRVQRR